jgi:hypothetical protein
MSTNNESLVSTIQAPQSYSNTATHIQTITLSDKAANYFTIVATTFQADQ